MSYTEDIITEIYNEVESKGLRRDFDKQIKRMSEQKKHKFKSISERWEYALYRIKGGEALNK
tara:strand:+ start:255 stop:440 length:186 start_codon:yes stop_codon:yes gene_type:complete